MSENMFSLKGKVAVVTGGSRGFGKAMALGLADAGADVAIASRTQADLDKVAEEIKAKGRKALAVATDTSSMEAVRNLGAKVMEVFGKVDILVNNAGQGTNVPFLNIKEEEWDRILNINLKGYFLSTQVIGGYMFKAKSGSIINISSAMGNYPLPFMTHYAASKGAINSLTKCLAQEWAGRGIRINAIAPAYFDTDINAQQMKIEAVSKLILSKTPLNRLGNVSELIGLVVYLASDASTYMTGAVLPLDGGWSAG